MKIKELLPTLVLIGTLFAAYITLDARYLKAEEANKQFQKIFSSLGDIRIDQLKEEARAIMRGTKLEKRNPSNAEVRRLEDINEQLEKLGSHLPFPIPRQ